MMIRTLIVEDNLNYVKSMTNLVINRIKEIHITNIATTIAEAINIIINNNIDLVFLDLKLPDATGMELINQIKNMNSIKKPKIIIISSELDLIQDIENKENFCVINKLKDSEFILNEIKEVTNQIKYSQNEEQIKKRIVYELDNIGYNFKYKGTQYIYDTILFIYQSNNLDLLNNVEKNVYKFIAYRYEKSVNNIKTNIIKATNLIKYDKYKEDNLTPKSIITNTLIKLIHEYY